MSEPETQARATPFLPVGSADLDDRRRLDLSSADEGAGPGDPIG